MKTATRALLLSAGYGWLAGMRNLAAPATAALWMARREGRVRGRFATALATPAARVGLPTLAFTEMAIDKWANAPDRTQPAILAARLASGALAGAAVAQALHGRRSAGRAAAIGAAAALVSSVVNLRVRRAAAARVGTSEQRAGFAEDALALGLGAALTVA